MKTIRLGLARGRVELRHIFTVPSELVPHFLPTLVFLAVLAFLRFQVAGGVSYGAVLVTGLLGSSLCFSSLTLMMQTLAADREDGTLLRARALPHGTPVYLIGRTIVVSLFGLISVGIMLVYALLLFHDLSLPGVGGWLKFAAVLVLGMLATLPIGAVLGSVFPNPRIASVVSVPLVVLLAVSGILFPVTVLPEWVQWTAQAFPMYWMGLGMRSVLLPDSTLVSEIGHSWRDWQTFAVLGAWALIGLVLAPIVLGRMTRRGTGAQIGKATRHVG